MTTMTMMWSILKYILLGAAIFALCYFAPVEKSTEPPSQVNEFEIPFLPSFENTTVCSANENNNELQGQQPTGDSGSHVDRTQRPKTALRNKQDRSTFLEKSGLVSPECKPTPSGQKLSWISRAAQTRPASNVAHNSAEVEDERFVSLPPRNMAVIRARQNSSLWKERSLTLARKGLHTPYAHVLQDDSTPLRQRGTPTKPPERGEKLTPRPFKLVDPLRELVCARNTLHWNLARYPELHRKVDITPRPGREPVCGVIREYELMDIDSRVRER
jgi:hypothetical protein